MSAPTTERVAPRAAGFHTLRVADVERLTDDAVAVTFDVPDALGDDFAFRAGQYLTLRLVTDAGRGAPLLLDLRARGRRAADRGAPRRHRAVLHLAGRPAHPRRRDRGRAAAGPLLPADRRLAR